MFRPSPMFTVGVLVPPVLLPLPSVAPAVESDTMLPVLPKLVPAASPVLSPFLPIRPCHWKPKSAALSPETSTIMLSI